MIPELFHIGPVVISSYGLMLATAFIVGISLAIRLARQRGINEDQFINLAFLIMISAIIGSRLLYVFTHLEEFEGRWIYTFLPVQPDGRIGLSGLIFLGGLIGAVISSIVYVRLKKMPVWKTADSIAPSLSLGLFFGRIGCFLNGCCFGKACELPWAVVFPEYSPAGAIMGSVEIHPTQLYAAGYAILIFLVLLWMNRSRLGDGAMSGIFLVLYGASRFSVDFLRVYESEMRLGSLYVNQWISLMLIIGGVAILYRNVCNRENALKAQ